MLMEYQDASSFDLVQVVLGILSFFVTSLGSLSIGVICGLFTAVITKFTKEVRVIEPLCIIALAHMSYLVAETLHWSGMISMIGCGLLQSFYAMDNISKKSFTTVKYFMKMLATLSDTIIFMLLGLEVIKTKHTFDGPLIAWTIFLCFIARAISVFGITAVANKTYRFRKVSVREQFIIFYGGIRGAVSYAIGVNIPSSNVHKYTFLTATFTVIVFTVFVQGTTVKPLVDLFGIDKAIKEVTMFEEINKQLTNHVLQAIQILVGQKGDNAFHSIFRYVDDNLLSKHLRVELAGVEDKMLRRYWKLLQAELLAQRDVLKESSDKKGKMKNLNEIYRELLEKSKMRQIRQQSVDIVHDAHALSTLLQQSTLQEDERRRKVDKRNIIDEDEDEDKMGGENDLRRKLYEKSGKKQITL
ncbi:DgyrCDS33 [Dimorphilus gyrociliatus]|uniref:Sodium/hydrogen exchanger n=1 Tax=Dimorphilus gyrociliatus TaxID=2664684 RepID=A0A7I8V7R7_9ANNE|nr:DgyrCDS33 [Dimorphilus gyrociliatus]